MFALSWIKRKLKRKELATVEQKNHDDICIDSGLMIHKEEFNKVASECIGTGNYGVVYKSYIPRYNQYVAVKVPNDIGPESIRSITREIRTISALGKHINILILLGVYTKEIQSGFVMMVTKYCKGGSLRDYLLQFNPYSDVYIHSSAITLYQLCRFCEEIFSGMQYLAEMGVIHGDLACRNVLLDIYNVCKIGDFGLSKFVSMEETHYVKPDSEPLAWAWSALETFESRLVSHKTDIWAMGVTFWEIFSLGENPFEELEYNSSFVTCLANGRRLGKPVMASCVIYEEMMKCWNLNPEERPTASDFVEFFDNQREDGITIVL